MPNAVKLIAGAAAGALSIGVAAVAFGAWPFWLQATLWAGACSSIGWIIGFLFGIPRTEPTAATAVAAAAAAAAPNPAAVPNPAIRLSVNTNLEQISDWLTKIIVGVTLTQWNAFITQLDFASKLIALSLGGAHMQSFAYALMVYFAATGFLSSYLLTRVFLQAVLGDAADGNNGN
ncbi:MAG: hypothetical protein JNM66_25460 [Bryobacterales bacterium]|nr:hypothetical protein [Bryobacterales bacterium]